MARSNASANASANANASASAKASASASSRGKVGAKSKSKSRAKEKAKAGAHVNQNESAHEKTKRVRGRIWIETEEGTWLGFGRVVLLERIRETGSLRAAAGSMQMSYRHAWELVDSMNRQSSRPLVEKVTGGRGGGGASLTPAGERAIRDFRALHRRLRRLLERETQRLAVAASGGGRGG